jgi:hypothetical protein
MVLDGSCGLWPSSDDLEPSDMVSIRSCSGDDGVCALCVEERVFCVMVITKSWTLIPCACVVMSIDCQCWIFVDGYYMNTSYPVSDIRIVHFQGKIL